MSSEETVLSGLKDWIEQKMRYENQMYSNAIARTAQSTSLDADRMGVERDGCMVGMRLVLDEVGSRIQALRREPYQGGAHVEGNPGRGKYGE